jgi:uncharacterized phiE125 gp8 family phage protein
MAGLVLVTPPAIEPVALDDLKDGLYISDPSQDELVTFYGVGARQVIEGDRYPGLDIALLTQTWDVFLDGFPSGVSEIVIPKPPLQTVTSVSWFDIANNETILDASTYYVDNTTKSGEGVSPARIWPTPGWPGEALRPVNGVKVRIVAGFGATVDKVPAGLKIAIQMLTGTFWENREATTEIAVKCLPFNFDSLTGQFRRDGT